MKKFIVGVVLLALVVPVLLAAGCGGQKVPAGAVAAVGSGVVTQQQYDQIFKQIQAQYKAQSSTTAFPKAGSAQYKALKASIVAYLVQNEILKQKAKDMGVSVTDKALATRMKAIVAQVGGQKKLDAMLKQQGFTMATAQERVKDQMLLEAVQAKVYAGIKVTDAEVEKYFNNPANASQFNTAATVTARHVLVKTKAEAEKVRALLVANNTDANWAAVAKKYSIDTGTKSKGGALGSFPKGTMVKPFENVAFSLGIGQISQPVKTSFGWHVIEVTQKTPGSKKTLAQAKATIQQQLQYQKQSTAWTSWLKQATKDAGVAYAPGYNPDQLTASPSPSASSK